ncbi:MAG: SulP family inorganic anion transporter [Bacteroidia bacterium]
MKPMNWKARYQQLLYLTSWKTDLSAGLMTFLVAVPLCLGIALASDAPMVAGLMAGVIGGTLVALISGSQVGVSGPAAGLVVIVLNAQTQVGSFEAFLTAVVAAGVIQILLGVIGGGIISYFFPNSVIKGMLAGIGAIIMIKQLPYLIGYEKGYLQHIDFFELTEETIFTQIRRVVGMMVHPYVLGLSVVAVSLLSLWETYLQKVHGVFRVVQGPLVVVMLSIGFQVFTGVFEEGQLVKVPHIDSMADLVGALSFPDFSQIGNHKVWVAAFTLAIVASLETLLCVQATDKLDPLKRVTPTNRELVAQGVGNTLAGLVGALPITQVIVRSSTNIFFGGKTKISIIFHGLLLLFSVIFLSEVLSQIPSAALASILFYVGYKLLSPKDFVEIFRAIRRHRRFWGLFDEKYVPFLVTFWGVVFTDLLVGVVLGFLVGIVYFIKNNVRMRFELIVRSENEYLLELPENVGFLDKYALRKTLDEIPRGARVEIDMRDVRYLHQDIQELLEEFAASAREKRIELVYLRYEDVKA